MYIYKYKRDPCELGLLPTMIRTQLPIHNLNTVLPLVGHVESNPLRARIKVQVGTTHAFSSFPKRISDLLCFKGSV